MYTNFTRIYAIIILLTDMSKNRKLASKHSIVRLLYFIDELSQSYCHSLRSNFEIMMILCIIRLLFLTYYTTSAISQRLQSYLPAYRLAVQSLMTFLYLHLLVQSLSNHVSFSL